MAGPDTVAVLLAPGSAGVRELLGAARAHDLRWVCLIDPEVHPGLLRTAEPLGEVLAVPAGRSARELAPELRRRDVRAVITFSDAWLPLTAELARELGVAGLSPGAAALATSKFAQRAALNAAGVCDVPHALADPAAALGPELFPGVVKPDRGVGAVHTHAVADADEARAALAAVGGQAMVIEARIPAGRHPRAPWLGDMCSVDTAVCDGELHHFGVIDRPPPATPFRETGMIAPSLLPAEQQVAILDVTARAIRALGIDDAVVHTELRSGTDRPEVIEVNARLGGYVDRLWTRAGVGSPLDAAIAIALGAPVNEPRPAQRCAVVRIVHGGAVPAALESVPSARTLRTLPGVFEVQLVNGPGDTIDPADGWNARILDVWLEAADAGEAAERLAVLDDAIATQLTTRPLAAGRAVTTLDQEAP